MKILSLAVVPMLMATMAAVSAAPRDDTDRAVLTAGVTTVDAPGGIPGDIVAFGKNTFTVISGKMGSSDLPVFAAARYGKGRAVAGGHEGFFGDEALKNGSNATFAANIATWVAGKPLRGLRVIMIDQSRTLRESLASSGAVVTETTSSNLDGKLEKADEIWLNQGSLDGRSSAKIRVVRDWVKGGGGLVVTGPGWGWEYEHPNLTLANDQSANRIVVPMGLAFSSGMLDRSSAGGFTAGVSSLTSVPEALSALQDYSAGKRTPTEQETDQATAVLGEALESIPAKSRDFRKIVDLCRNRETAIPTPQTPVTKAMPFARLRCFLDAHWYKTLPASKIPADPSASTFPGSVPAGAKREHATVSIDTSVPDWHGTGLYAVAGEPITITLPESASAKGLSVRIGSDTDALWGADKWKRFPEISMTFPLKSPTNRVASAFGGAVYIVVPENCDAGTIDVSIDGAITAPFFVRGVTTNDEWKRTIRNAPGPWAELEGNLVAISIPSSAVRDLDDPEALMAHWDSMMEDCYAFFAAPKRPRPERYSTDRQITIGYFHSGYPIMAPMDAVKSFCDLETLNGSNGLQCWGFYHEMGHNFQQPEWTWADLGEVTNNLFSLYETEKINGDMSGAHPEMTLAKMAAREHEVAAQPGRERYYARDPWYGLTMFWLMRHEFGWAPFTMLFAEFQNLPDSEKPHTELEKHDQFLVRFSKATGHNLTQYLSAWGVETSSQAQSAVSSLPGWMPADWK